MCCCSYSMLLRDHCLANDRYPRVLDSIPEVRVAPNLQHHLTTKQHFPNSPPSMHSGDRRTVQGRETVPPHIQCRVHPANSPSASTACSPTQKQRQLHPLRWHPASPRAGRPQPLAYGVTSSSKQRADGRQHRVLLPVRRRLHCRLRLRSRMRILL